MSINKNPAGLTTMEFIHMLPSRRRRKPSIALILQMICWTLLTGLAALSSAFVAPTTTRTTREDFPRFSRIAKRWAAPREEEARDSGYFLQDLLQKYSFESRLLTFSKSDLPLLAECQQQGQAQLVQITDLIFKEDSTNSIKLEISSCAGTNDGETTIVDLGQVTTLWPFSVSSSLAAKNIDKFISEDPALKLPLGHLDRSLDRLYDSYVGRARSTDTNYQHRSLTKKQISKLVGQAPPTEQSLVDQVLRQVIKTGNSFARLVDSEIVRDFLFDFNKKGDLSLEVGQRAMAAKALGDDAQAGGRFKRFGCLVVSHSDNILTVINGGWVVVDQNVRATSEARKFAERGGPTASRADDRIVSRLECLAMGGDNMDDEAELQIDVRETLRAMNLPISPKGAKEALIQIGHWTPSSPSNESKQAVDPWSQSVMEAANWYQQMDEQRRSLLLHYDKSNNQKLLLEGRTDLSKLPCVCVDASRTTFRDDAIGIRSRASTGRRVTEASKWEILLHIADVSDLYSPQPTGVAGDANDDEKQKSQRLLFLQILREAAANRGTSRYDLPLGPLHLLPPTVLHSLSLTSSTLDMTSQAPMRPKRGINRCVTLWVYIDEATGKLLDAGLERTLISAPLAFSYHSATAILDGTIEKQDPVLDKAKALLGVAERNLNLWSNFHRSKNKAAQSREDRLSAREVVGKEVYGTISSRDDGREGFQRSRGHRLVDSALNLYGYALNGLLYRKDVPIPQVAGTGRNRLGRVATAPLRRYIDGVAQRQALSVLCNYGGKALTRKEAASEGKKATSAINAISNIKSFKSHGKMNTPMTNKKSKEIRSLQRHLKEHSGPIPAMSTGNQNEVVILGIGAVASCKGIRGTLKPGEKIMVDIQKIDEASGRISAVLV